MEHVETSTCCSLYASPGMTPIPQVDVVSAAPGTRPGSKASPGMSPSPSGQPFALPEAHQGAGAASSTGAGAGAGAAGARLKVLDDEDFLREATAPAAGAAGAGGGAAVGGASGTGGSLRNAVPMARKVREAKWEGRGGWWHQGCRLLGRCSACVSTYVDFGISVQGQLCVEQQQELEHGLQP